MDRLIEYNKAKLFYTNEATLIHAFLSGRVLAYDKNTLAPINGKDIRIFFQEIGEIFDTPEVYFNKNAAYQDPKTGIFYTRTYGSTEKTDSWIELYHTLRELPETIKNDPDFYEYFEKGYPLDCQDILTMKRGIGIEEGRQILFDSLFKEKELKQAFTSEDEVKQVRKIFNRSLQAALDYNQKQAPPEKPQKKEGAIEQLELMDLKGIFPSISAREIDGYKEFKEGLKKAFRDTARAAVAVIAYCHQQNKRLRRDDLQDLLDNPTGKPGAEALAKYKGKLSRELIQDIYTELPEEYRHKRGQSKTKE